MASSGGATRLTDHSMNILSCLDRLNDKDTQRAAADDLAGLVRGLDAPSFNVLVNSVCNTGNWRPSAFARREGMHALGLLVSHVCPVSDLALKPPVFPKLLSHVKKYIQDADAGVRDASVDTLFELAAAVADSEGGSLPGTSAVNPFLRIVFSCLAEQKKDSQAAGSKALLKLAPLLAPLEKDLVKLLLRYLRSSTFQATAALLGSLANTGSGDVRRADGLLKDGGAAFLPYVHHLIGQPAGSHGSTSSGGGSGASGGGTGILGCLSSEDWAVRRGAADALSAAALILGPDLEPDGVWGPDPASLTGRCLAALEEARFDKVKEARHCIREAIGVLHELQRFGSQGPGNWAAAAAALEAAVLSAPGVMSAQSSGGGTAFSPPTGTSRPPTGGGAGRLSSVAQRFQKAACPSDAVAGSKQQGGGGSTGGGSVRASWGALDPGALLGAKGEGVDAAAEGAGVGGEEEGELIAAVRISCAADSEPEDAELHQQDSADEAAPSSEARRRWSQNGTPERPASGAGAVAGGKRVTTDRGSRHTSRRGTGDQQDVSAGGAVAKGRTTAAAIETSRSASAGARRRTGEAAAAPAARGGPSNGDRSAATQRASSASGKRRNKGPSTAAAGAEASSGAAGAAAGADAVSVAPRLPAAALVPQTDLAEAAGVIGSPRHSPRRPTSTCHPSEATADSARNTTVTVDAREWGDMQQQVHLLKQQQLSMAAMLQQLTERFSGAVGSLQSRISVLEAQQMANAQQPIDQMSPVAAAPPAAAATKAPAGAAHSPRTRVSPTPLAVPAPPQLGGLTPVLTFKGQGSLSRSVDDSGGKGTPAQVVRALGGVSASASAGLWSASFDGLAISSPSTPVPCDYEAAYVNALRLPSEMHLLRLVMKTGPCWTALSDATAAGLLAAFTRCVRDGVMLHRLLPWLWRLADDDCRQPEVAAEARRDLLDALATCPAAEDVQTQEKVQLLISTLTAVWSADAWQKEG